MKSLFVFLFLLNITIYNSNSEEIYVWGENNNIFGDNTISKVDTPMRIGSDNDWKYVSSGSPNALGFAIAIKNDGTLWGWGNKANFHLGDSTNFGIALNPIQIGTENDWKLVACGSHHVNAIKEDGTLWTWGYNQFGIGIGNDEYARVPTQIGTDNNWKLVACGNSHSIAIKEDGTLWAWGWNLLGQLGDGTGNSSSTPIQISTDANWYSVAAANSNSIALKTDGTLWTWGFNIYGQLGDSSTTNSNMPIQITEDTDWKYIAQGNLYSFAIKEDGTLWSWGRNDAGQLGNGTNEDALIPTQVNSDNDWKSIACGGGHSIALKTDGTLWSWGNNSSGQLGDGQLGIIENRNVPEKIDVDYNWTFIHCGLRLTIALVDVETGVEDFYNQITQQTSIFPNPANDIINIKSYKTIERIEIVNYLGNTVLSKDYSGFEQIKINSLPNGVYLIKMFTSDREILTQKLILLKQ